MAGKEFGDNIVAEIKGEKLTLTIDLSKNLGISSSGKSQIIASTRGFVHVNTDGVYLGLNCYKFVKRNNL